MQRAAGRIARSGREARQATATASRSMEIIIELMRPSGAFSSLFAACAHIIVTSYHFHAFIYRSAFTARARAFMASADDDAALAEEESEAAITAPRHAATSHRPLQLPHISHDILWRCIILLLARESQRASSRCQIPHAPRSLSQHDAGGRRRLRAAATMPLHTRHFQVNRTGAIMRTRDESHFTCLMTCCARLPGAHARLIPLEGAVKCLLTRRPPPSSSARRDDIAADAHQGYATSSSARSVAPASPSRLCRRNG